MEYPKRKSPRLKDYDYSQAGAYFVTICTKNRQKLFWESVGASIARPQDAPLTAWGKIVDEAISNISLIYPQVSVDCYVIMPNHIHLIVIVAERHIGRSLPQIIRWFKSMTTNNYINYVKKGILKPFNEKLWQKSYHDHIIRDEKDYMRIWKYIDTNAIKWEQDCFYINKTEM